MFTRSFHEKVHERIIEFNKTEPEVAQGLIREIMVRRNEHKELISRIYTIGQYIAERVHDAGLVREIELSNDILDKYSKTFVAGIDGSFQVVGGRGRRYYVLLTAIIVELPRGIHTRKDEFKKRYPGIKVIPFDDPSLGEEVIDIAEDSMMVFETSALKEIIRTYEDRDQCPCVFIDGPIIDPPRPPSRYSTDILRSLGISDYIDFRANTLLEAWRKGLIIYGYVKYSRSNRFLKDMLKDKLKLHNNVLDVFSGDEELAYTILNIITLTYRKLGYKKYFYIGPFTISWDREPFMSYFEKGIKVYFIYAINRALNKAIRLEIAVPRNYDNEETILNILEEGYKIMLSITLPGNLHPLPIILAHEKCRIRKGAAELIYELTLGSIFKEILGENDIIAKLVKLGLLSETSEKY